MIWIASTTHKIKKPNTPNDIPVHKETSGAVRRRQRKRVIALNKVTVIDEVC